MKNSPSHFVVDADIARAAGVTEHPISKAARDMLKALMDSESEVAFCPTLLSEWRTHRSLYATRWLSSMIARKRIFRLTPPSISLNEIEKSPLTDQQKSIANKDAHVIDLAVATGKFIASNDKAARQVFCLIAGHSNLLNGIFWAVPTDCGEKLSACISKNEIFPSEWKISAI